MVPLASESRAPRDSINTRILPFFSIVQYGMVYYSIVYCNMVWCKYMYIQGSCKPWFLVSSLYWALEPECEILM